jgi:transposase
VDPATLGIVVADVSGKGVPGSLVMTMIRTAMRLEARNNRSANDVLTRVNTHVTGDMKKNMFVTMFYIILDSRNRSINFASAGHNPMILYRADNRQVYYLNPHGFPLGVDLPEKDQFRKRLALQRVQLHKDDMLVIYTDGITEAMDRDKKQFGEDRLVSTIRRYAYLTPKSFVEKLNQSIAEFTKGAEQNDDITVVAIKEKMKAESVVYRFRKKLIDLVEKEGLSVAEASRRMSTTPAMYYRFKKILEEKGRAALRPHLSKSELEISELSNDQKHVVITAVRSHPEWGAERIAEELRKRGSRRLKADPKLIQAYLKRKSLSQIKDRKTFAANEVDTL